MSLRSSPLASGSHALLAAGVRPASISCGSSTATGTTLDVKSVVMVHPYWDMAILEVENVPAIREPLGSPSAAEEGTRWQ